VSARPSPAEWAAWLAQPRPRLTLAQVEAWLRRDDPPISDECKACCPECDGWGGPEAGVACPICRGAGIVTAGAWRAHLRARIEEETS